MRLEDKLRGRSFSHVEIALLMVSQVYQFVWQRMAKRFVERWKIMEKVGYVMGFVCLFGNVAQE